MADAQVKKKIYKMLKEGYFSDPDDAVDVSDGPEDSIHLVIFSRKFTGRSMKEKHDLIWSELMQKLGTDEWNKVSLSIGASPEEIKATLTTLATLQSNAYYLYRRALSMQIQSGTATQKLLRPVL